MRRASGGRLGLIVVTVWTALAVLTACSSDGPAAHGVVRPVLPGGAAGVLGKGTLYLLLGDEAISANLWRVDLGTERVQQLTFNPPQHGVSNFSASTAGLVLGNARSGVDEADIMVAGRPRPLSGGVGDSPQINSAGQIVDVAFAEQGVRHGPWSRDRLLYWANPASRYRAIYKARPPRRQAPSSTLADLAWSPAGTMILAAEGPDAYYRLFAVNARGQVVERFVTVPGFPRGWAWGRYGLAVGYRTGRHSVVLGESGRVRAKLPGKWIPGCWNPAGTMLLVATPNRERIGIWTPASPGHVRDLGRLPGGALQECSWTARPARGTDRPS
jgi:hypothetical protein